MECVGARRGVCCVSSIAPYVLRKLPPWRPEKLPHTVTYVVRGVCRGMLEDVLNYLSCNASKLPYAEQTNSASHGFIATQLHHKKATQDATGIRIRLFRISQESGYAGYYKNQNKAT